MQREEIEKIILSRVEKNFEEELDFLSQLVKFRSLTGEEGDAQQFYARACRQLGLDTELLESDLEIIQKHPAYVHIDYPYEGRPNVVASLNKAGNSRSLILNGHIDVVSPEPLSEWTVDPWGGEIKNGLLYGRGALDMKAGLAVNFFALKAIMDEDLRPMGAVTLESVIEEELGGSGGTLACFLKGVTADGMIISEPSKLDVWITHPGIKYFRVKVLGRTAHAARSHEGVNAIGKMIPIIQALESLDRERAEKLTFPLVEEQTGRSCNLSLGRMIAGDWVSTVAGWADLECRIGFVPNESGKEVMTQIEDTVHCAVEGDSWFDIHPPKIEWFGWDTEPWTEPQNSELVNSFLNTSRKVLGLTPRLSGASGGLDTRFGPYFDTSSIAFGPMGANYHGIDEYVDVASLLKVTSSIALFIADWCGIMR
jgi:acetylornithine deacetylase